MKRILALFFCMVIFFTQVSYGFTLTIKDKHITVTYDKTAGQLVTLTKNSPDVVGWDTSDASVTITNNQFIMPNSNLEIEPIYSNTQYTLTIVTTNKIISESKYVGEKVVVIDNNKGAFKSWTATGITLTPAQRVSNAITFNMPNKDVTLTAIYLDLERYVVSYDANSGINPPEDQIKFDGVDLTLSSDVPTRDGYEFLGWSTSRNGTTAEYKAGGIFTADSDTKLYAVWKETLDTYTITYDANNGINAPGAQTKEEGVELILYQQGMDINS